MDGLRRAFVVTWAVALVTACGSHGSDNHRGQRIAPVKPATRTRAKPPPPLYGPNGALLPSDRSIAGLEMPRGLEQTIEARRRHVFTTRVPLAKVQRYFGTRLITGQVDRIGEGAVFHAAVPRHVEGGVVKLDVSILPIPGDKTRVEVVELAPPPVHPPSEALIRAQAIKDAQHAM